MSNWRKNPLNQQQIASPPWLINGAKVQEEGFLQSQASAITQSSKLWKGWFLFSPFVDVTTRNLRTVLPTSGFDMNKFGICNSLALKIGHQKIGQNSNLANLMGLYEFELCRTSWRMISNHEILDNFPFSSISFDEMASYSLSLLILSGLVTLAS